MIGKNFIKKAASRIGYEVKSVGSVARTLSDLSSEESAIINDCSPFTMTSLERMASLVNSLNYISANEISGDIVECGVWRGGSMMIAAKILLNAGDTSRDLYLYDTYEGMSEPTVHDRSYNGVTAEHQLEVTPRGEGVWCEAGIDDVRENILSTGYPEEKIHFIKGKVEDTIPKTIPSHIAVLRLDTDWYESTHHELKYLYPIVSGRGIVIIDDYGHWDGAKKAVDEYLRENDPGLFLTRIDATGRLLQKRG